MVSRVALILGVFDSPGKHLHLDEIVADTGLPRSSTHRILTQLHAAGLLTHGPDGYCLTAAALPATVDHSQLRGVASPVLKRLRADTALVVHLGVLAGPDVVYLDKVGGIDGVAVPTRVAGRTPAHASALGKAMLARLAAEEVDSEPFDAVVRLLTERARHEVTSLVPRVAAEPDLQHDVQWLTWCIDQLRDQDAAADAAEQLVAWLGSRGEGEG